MKSTYAICILYPYPIYIHYRSKKGQGEDDKGINLQKMAMAGLTAWRCWPLEEVQDHTKWRADQEDHEVRRRKDQSSEKGSKLGSSKVRPPSGALNKKSWTRKSEKEASWLLYSAAVARREAVGEGRTPIVDTKNI